MAILEMEFRVGNGEWKGWGKKQKLKTTKTDGDGSVPRAGPHRVLASPASGTWDRAEGCGMGELSWALAWVDWFHFEITNRTMGWDRYGELTAPNPGLTP